MLKYSVLKFTKKYLPPSIRRALMYAYIDTLSFLKYGDRNFPSHIWIEINTECNRACRYCPNSVNPLKAQHMSLETFDRILDRLVELKWSGPVGYHNVSEPLLHPDIIKFIRLTKRRLPKSMPILFTNGDYLTLELAKELRDVGIFKVSISKHKPISKEWEERIASIVNLDSFMFEFKALTSGELINWGGALKNIKNPPFSTCLSPKRVLSIRVTGEIALCCCDYSSQHTFGNVLSTPILELWDRPRWRKLRRELRHGIKKLEICQDCTGVQ